MASKIDENVRREGNMASKIDENALFYYYILDPKRRRRERKYALIHLVCSIAFIMEVYQL